MPFVSLNNFRFDITRTGILNSLAVFFGAQDIHTGYKGFDTEFVIKASRNDLMLHLVKNAALRKCLEAQPEVNFLIGNRRGIWEAELPKGHLEMGYFIDGACKDMARMLSIYELVCLWLDALLETKTIERIPSE